MALGEIEAGPGQVAAGFEVFGTARRAGVQRIAVAGEGGIERACTRAGGEIVQQGEGALVVRQREALFELCGGLRQIALRAIDAAQRAMGIDVAAVELDRVQQQLLGLRVLAELLLHDAQVLPDARTGRVAERERFERLQRPLELPLGDPGLDQREIRARNRLHVQMPLLGRCSIVPAIDSAESSGCHRV